MPLFTLMALPSNSSIRSIQSLQLVSKLLIIRNLYIFPLILFMTLKSNHSILSSNLTNLFRLNELVQQGVISQKRCDNLCSNIWSHDLILHEAGVPPIHTPMKVLSNLPNEVLFLLLSALKLS